MQVSGIVSKRAVPCQCVFKEGLPDPCCVITWTSRGHLKRDLDLLNLRALKFSHVNEIHIVQCMGKVFCVEFQRVPLLHTCCGHLAGVTSMTNIRMYYQRYKTTLHMNNYMKHHNFCLIGLDLFNDDTHPPGHSHPTQVGFSNCCLWTMNYKVLWYCKVMEINSSQELHQIQIQLGIKIKSCIAYLTIHVK